VSGAANPDSSVGCYSPDAECYEVFSPFFDDVIQLYHGFDPRREHHHTDLDSGKLSSLPTLTDQRIRSTRIRCGRNLAGFPFAPGITRDERFDVERKVVAALSTLKGDLSGSYEPLVKMTDERQQQLIAEHILFKDMSADPYLAVAGCARNWPEARGIFMNEAKTAFVWVNEEDGLRIGAMEKGADFLGVFDRFCRLVNSLKEQLEFAYDERRGYLGACPTNIGTSMRASVHVALPKLVESGKLNDIALEYGLSVRGIHGEHSESEGGVVDISNKKRIGVSEVSGVKLMYDGLVHLLKEEDTL
jgi:creatine kinase/arginine kinase